jgi:predicted dithiol-disulfide oxidoreductase (DUF899 family)
VYHFMFGPGWGEGCPHCSFWADHYDSVNLHLGQRDTTLVVISRAPLKEIIPYKKRMGWKFDWLSSNQTDFNFDFNVSFTPGQLRASTAVYNYAPLGMDIDEREGVSAFYRDRKGDIYHTYSSYARGIDLPWLFLSFLGLGLCLGFACWLLHASWQSLCQGGLDLLPLLYESTGVAISHFTYG